MPERGAAGWRRAGLYGVEHHLGSAYGSWKVKAKPVKLVAGEGYVECPVNEATHVRLKFPSPAGVLHLPVILRGKREGTGCWTWDGDVENPTLKPSVKTEGVEYLGGDPALESSHRAYVCHSWVNGGVAKFLSDSTHVNRCREIQMEDV